MLPALAKNVVIDKLNAIVDIEYRADKNLRFVPFGVEKDDYKDTPYLKWVK